MNNQSPLLCVQDLCIDFVTRGQGLWAGSAVLHAVRDLSLQLNAGETLGIVGESGSGKSTLARAIVGMQPVTAGKITFNDQDVTNLSLDGWRRLRRQVQMVFQDPLASLNPRMTIGENIAEPLINLFPEFSRVERWRRVLAILPRVGLQAAWVNRYPHEFSGGQCQRVGIARALVVRPKLLICDEAVSALDVTIQAQIIALLKEIKAELNLAMLFIAHDLAVVKEISQRVLVMYRGEAMEQADTATLFAHPRHAYTQALLASVPIPDPVLEKQRQQRRIAISVQGQGT